MINKIEIDEFLKCQDSYYKEHLEISILKDHMYQALETYGISSEEKQNGNIKYMFSQMKN